MMMLFFNFQDPFKLLEVVAPNAATLIRCLSNINDDINKTEDETKDETEDESISQIL